ncbi:oxidoreductase [Spirochaetia bacterium]|nr:oxidoreductase [Spirochaetia bacterium]
MMDYIKLGNTKLEVSRFCLGCMSFGDEDPTGLHKWAIDEGKSHEILKRALDLGINFFDTANIYSAGKSEEIIGRGIKKFANRHDIVLETKVFFNEYEGSQNKNGLSREAILSEIDKSLKRLQTDYIDLYVIHRWDYDTPVEETMTALHEVVKSGKVRYIGASAMYAWQFMKAQMTAEKLDLTKFVTMQNHLNLIYREEEREMLPLCKEQKVALTPYSPLAGGRLARNADVQTDRSKLDHINKGKYGATIEQDTPIIERVGEIAEKHHVSRIAVALAWLMQKNICTVPIIGATKLQHVEDACVSVDFRLTEDEIVYLEEPYVPHKVVGAL